MTLWWSVLLALLLQGCSAMRRVGELDASFYEDGSDQDATAEPDAPFYEDGSDQDTTVEPDAPFYEDGSDQDATVEPDAEGSPCDTPVFQLHSDGTLEFSSSTTLTACIVETNDVGIPIEHPYIVRVDVEGSPVCENLARPCEQRWGEPCSHECVSDSDCPLGNVCVCNAGAPPLPSSSTNVYATGGPANRCVPAECTGASDCNGWACGMSEATGEMVNGTFICQGITEGFFCRSSKDECSSDLDCENGQSCAYNGVNWQCQFKPLCD